MTDTPRAIHAEYVSFRYMERSKALRMVFDVPAEQAAAALSLLGTPDFEKGTPVSIELMEQIEISVTQELAGKIADKKKRAFTDLPYSQQAALLCKNYHFQESLPMMRPAEMPTYSFENQAADSFIKEKLGIKSKSELDDPNNIDARNKFERMRDDHFAKTRSYPEQRG